MLCHPVCVETPMATQLQQLCVLSVDAVHSSFLPSDYEEDSLVGEEMQEDGVMGCENSLSWILNSVNVDLD